MLKIHHPEMRERIRPTYSTDELARLQQYLQAAGTFDFASTSTGLYPAADLSADAGRATGYGHVWVRDNVHVAHALEIAGQTNRADRVVLALARFYADHSARFLDIVDGARSASAIMQRPHIRFNGAELVEIPEPWAHAQNDALGYFLWFYCRRAAAGAFAADAALIEMFALYFEAIAYWRDADSGHWEETAKVEASSIGCIVAALRLTRAWARGQGASPWRRGFTEERLERLLAAGEAALAAILPWECRGPVARRYDAALLFLIYPLDVVAPETARRICDDVVAHLAGDYGVRRYLGDSYWTADYKQKLDERYWTGDFSLKLSERDRIAAPGEEAQWCLFDPILSVIAGRQYLQTGAREDRERQALHFNRALGQLTGPEARSGGLRCPEAYYREGGAYVPNDHVPLLWTQANLLAAFVAMQASAA